MKCKDISRKYLVGTEKTYGGRAAADLLYDCVLLLQLGAHCTVSGGVNEQSDAFRVHILLFVSLLKLKENMDTKGK